MSRTGEKGRLKICCCRACARECSCCKCVRYRVLEKSDYAGEKWQYDIIYADIKARVADRDSGDLNRQEKRIWIW
jgi:hypothetical protein